MQLHNVKRILENEIMSTHYQSKKKIGVNEEGCGPNVTKQREWENGKNTLKLDCFKCQTSGSSFS